MIPKIILTSAGAALLAKVPGGYAVPVTRWQIGKGALPAGSSLDRTALVEPVEYIPIYEISNQGSEALILGQFTNRETLAAFSFEELGLLAQDPEEGEILLCYGNAFGDGEVIQAASEQLREFIFGAQLQFSGEANMTGEISRGLMFIPMAEKGMPEGVASLDKRGKVPKEQLPELSFVKGDISIQIPTSGWALEGAEKEDFPYAIEIPCQDVLESHSADIKVERASMADAHNCGLCPTMETGNGFVKFWSRTVPENEILCHMTLFGEGDISGGGASSSSAVLGAAKIGELLLGNGGI